MEPDRSRRRLAGRAADNVRQGLEHFWQTMALRLAPADGVLTARIVGEFSAGKTRLLKELISGSVPAELLPISSLERQTRLQLEITYGSTPALTLIERSEDRRAGSGPLQTFAAFPARDDLDRVDPMRHRLRLTVPDERFVLPDGDGYFDDGNAPKRLFLIDTPGWNSGDDALAERPAAALMKGDHNLALVYVTSAARIDSDVNAGRLKDFLGVVADDATFYGDGASLVVVVTRCPGDEAGRACERASARIRDAWKSIDGDDAKLDLAVLAIDFDEAPQPELDAFRAAFWEALMAPIRAEGEAAPANGVTAPDWRAHALGRECEAWPVRPAIEASHGLLAAARTITDRALKDGSYLFGMNRHKLRRQPPAEAKNQLRLQWHRQLGGDPRALRLTTEALPAFEGEHPLAVWWRTYWLPELESVLRPVRGFLDAMERVLEAIDADTPDIQSAIADGVRAVHQFAQGQVCGSFALLLDAAAATAALPVDRQVATLLSLSVLESHYHDCRDDARADLQRERL